jgi:hypothetical protein
VLLEMKKALGDWTHVESSDGKKSINVDGVIIESDDKGDFGFKEPEGWYILQQPPPYMNWFQKIIFKLSGRMPKRKIIFQSGWRMRLRRWYNEKRYGSSWGKDVRFSK